MKIHSVTQGEAEWLQLRVGRVTASEMHNILSPTFEIRKGEMPQTYLAKKLAEAWRGAPLPGFTSFATDQGNELEDEARRWYAFTFSNEKIRNVGFVEHDDGRCGGSPDALIDDDCGLELKSPNIETHVKYVLKGTVPADYVTQVHASMYVTGRPKWKFVSYRRGFPALVLTIERDKVKMDAISEALAGFYEKFDEAFERLNAASATRKKNPFAK